jgi:RNA polymerase sigma-70 factor, ECF subfamily
MEQSRSLYESWVRAHAAELYRMAHRLTGGPEAAEDLVQETFTEAWRFMGNLRDSTKARPWLYRILRHRYAHWMRDSGRRVSASVSLDRVAEPSARDGQEGTAGVDTRDSLSKALERLSDEYKEPFLMVFLEGLSCRETAQELDIPFGTVLSRIHRARQALSRSLHALEAGHVIRSA